MIIFSITVSGNTQLVLYRFSLKEREGTNISTLCFFFSSFCAKCLPDPTCHLPVTCLHAPYPPPPKWLTHLYSAPLIVFVCSQHQLSIRL